jgi:hypothetical protein
MPPGIRFEDLVQVMDFIYFGEIKLTSDDLNSFMALAEHLKIRGLTDDDKQQQQQQHQKFAQKPPAARIPASEKRKGPPNPPGHPAGLKRSKNEQQFHHQVSSLSITKLFIFSSGGFRQFCFIEDLRTKFHPKSTA